MTPDNDIKQRLFGIANGIAAAEGALDAAEARLIRAKIYIEQERTIIYKLIEEVDESNNH
jgi:hypothetical protein